MPLNLLTNLENEGKVFMINYVPSNRPYKFWQITIYIIANVNTFRDG